MMYVYVSVCLAFFFVDSKNNNNFVPTHTNELLHRSNTSSGQFREQNHAFSITVFELFISATSTTHGTDLLEGGYLPIEHRHPYRQSGERSP